MLERTLLNNLKIRTAAPYPLRGALSEMCRITPGPGRRTMNHRNHHLIQVMRVPLGGGAPSRGQRPVRPDRGMREHAVRMRWTTTGFAVAALCVGLMGCGTDSDSDSKSTTTTTEAGKEAVCTAHDDLKQSITDLGDLSVRAEGKSGVEAASRRTCRLVLRGTRSRGLGRVQAADRRRETGARGPRDGRRQPGPRVTSARRCRTSARRSRRSPTPPRPCSPPSRRTAPAEGRIPLTAVNLIGACRVCRGVVEQRVGCRSSMPRSRPGTVGVPGCVSVSPAIVSLLGRIWRRRRSPGRTRRRVRPRNPTASTLDRANLTQDEDDDARRRRPPLRYRDDGLSGPHGAHAVSRGAVRVAHPKGDGDFVSVDPPVVARPSPSSEQPASWLHVARPRRAAAGAPRSGRGRHEAARTRRRPGRRHLDSQERFRVYATPSATPSASAPGER